MGICDLIPGISGGTIAFITGIYERLITGIKNITFKNYFNLLINLIKLDKKNIKKNIKKLDIYFLFFLFFGISSAIFSGAKLMSFLLENYYMYLITFFIGLILASSLIIFKEIKIHNKSNFIFLFIGLILGILFLFLSPFKISNPSFYYVLLGGFLAIFALFLPGISGSFILLILGIYKYIIDLVKNLDLINLIPFAIGALLSIGIISRLISYLFKKDKSKTLYFLLGLVIGTLFIPIVKVIKSIQILTIILFFKLLILFLTGFFIIFLINKLNKN